MKRQLSISFLLAGVALITAGCTGKVGVTGGPGGPGGNGTGPGTGAGGASTGRGSGGVVVSCAKAGRAKAISKIIRR